MGEYTENLKLFKYKIPEDNELAFSIERALNENWDRIDKIALSFQQLQQAIGNPIITLNNTLNDNEIWLEGATVSRTTYAELFNIFGTTYGSGDGSSTFTLPDFRNRALWGSNSFGYIEAGLPNITGEFQTSTYPSEQNVSGVFQKIAQAPQKHYAGGNSSLSITYSFNASLASSIYGNSTTVQPPAIKVRVKTRYK